MKLLTKPIEIDAGAWISSRCVVLGGVKVGRSALVGPMTVIASDISPNTIVKPRPSTETGTRFRFGPPEKDTLCE
ncbi:hypothetical protein QMK22_15955 [Cryobacterium sp. PH29-G1]|nr:hypothetical protein [Cryobacterium sp. PH29-G1]MDJ0350804.1 hypothetical protein [Cryobacterium sp. PH29-G1]